MGSLWPASKNLFGGIPFKIIVLYCVSLSILKFFPKRYKWLPFFAVLLQPKTKQKAFLEFFERLGRTDGETDGERPPVIYIINIIIHVYNFTL